ncbi:hypothetical protein P4C99_08155 [Pontiellaceae bacterium B1224]|nr:hypothetical protein [Pontiellaceae bacterium B1224]
MIGNETGLMVRLKFGRLCRKRAGRPFHVSWHGHPAHEPHSSAP